MRQRCVTMLVDLVKQSTDLIAPTLTYLSRVMCVTDEESRYVEVVTRDLAELVSCDKTSPLKLAADLPWRLKCVVLTVALTANVDQAKHHALLEGLSSFMMSNPSATCRDALLVGLLRYSRHSFQMTRVILETVYCLGCSTLTWKSKESLEDVRQFIKCCSSTLQVCPDATNLASIMELLFTEGGRGASGTRNAHTWQL
eukprot:Blabericola_migrator_1__5630@NODE_285_length_10382_cov_182_229956_g235_i0_p6_GENE_NODE_285_length_10382_cov_182_229956_g235_i0NODE_285_length_10382_cov_182_229956_g235_i0_p6_ORF_typecomplete_len199_score18_33PH_17/PF18012_1/0_059_NODE_285_length_10382_cov_182_229956_g235_i037494345